jgi:hypothetical protein
MSVEEALGISTEMAMEIVGRRWPDWTKTRPVLRQVEVADVGRRLREGDARTVGEVMHALAWLAATDGGDDVEAASVVAWMLVPVAGRVANELHTMAPEIDSLVASQLWIEVRTVNWRASSRVAANIGKSLRRNLLREARLDGRRPVSVELVLWPELFEWLWPAGYDSGSEDPEQTLLSVLDWGVEHGTIQPSDRDLLLAMVAVSAGDPCRRSPRRALLAAAGVLGPELGITPRSVRRRGRRALDALAAHAGELSDFVEPLAS